MAYSAITNLEIDPDSPVTTALMTKYRDNIIAVYEDTRLSAVKAGNEDVNNDNALDAANDSELIITLGTPEIWIVRACIQVTATTNAGFKARFQLSAGGTVSMLYTAYNSPSTLERVGTAVIDFLPAVNMGQEPVFMDGYITTTVGATLQLQWCQSVNHVDITTVHSNSWISAQRFDAL